VKYLILVLSLLFAPVALSAQMFELPVARVEFCANSQFECPRWRPFVRLEDMRGPIWFLISTSEMGCEVNGLVAGKLDRGRDQRWLCAWRVARYNP